MKTEIYSTTDSNILADYFTANVKKSLLEIADYKGINFSRAKAQEYFKKTAIDRINTILQEIRKDSKKADLFNGLQSERIDPLVKTTFMTSLKHSIIMYAEEILNNSKI